MGHLAENCRSRRCSELLSPGGGQNTLERDHSTGQDVLKDGAAHRQRPANEIDQLRAGKVGPRGLKSTSLHVRAHANATLEDIRDQLSVLG